MASSSINSAYNPTYNVYQQQALSGANSGILDMASKASMLAQALGPQTSSGAFGNLPPEAMLGLMPDQVTGIANTRAENALKQMMTNMHVLDFVRKASGQDLTDKLTEQAFKDAGIKDADTLKGEYALKHQELANKASKYASDHQDIERVFNVKAMDRVVRAEQGKLGENEAPISPFEKALVTHLAGIGDRSLELAKFIATQESMGQINERLMPYDVKKPGARDAWIKTVSDTFFRTTDPKEFGNAPTLTITDGNGSSYKYNGTGSKEDINNYTKQPKKEGVK